ncbi:hypothetical protein DMN91_006043 [Ooceraea biroi]|uniref:Reverse transcriptase domain-containing protein n=1 Tax=Ooceraea biroi TaxID=2015173 RepID=A0A3L8DMM9_OOCBI|nr:hypothetical protein DMN91_006043 [Ooceraea biroi]
MIELLSDQTTYKRLKKDPIKQITNKINNLVRVWRDNDLIDEVTYKALNCANGNTPHWYGLPKIRREGYPLRNIVSTIGSSLYGVASFLHNILQKTISQPKSFVEDSWSFVSSIVNKQIRSSEIMVSLDVSSLFTNIPSELVMSGIERRWSDISCGTKLIVSLGQFLHAIDLILGSISFTFNGQSYEQIFGSPMGSTLSPILANIVMEDLETHCLSLLEFDVPWFCRYVDDTFAILPKAKLSECPNLFDEFAVLSLEAIRIFEGPINYRQPAVFRADRRCLYIRSDYGD